MSNDLQPRAGRGRPARITREAILDAVSKAPNLDSLSMRDLALTLNVSHAALYRWVKNRDGLFDLVSRAVVDRIVLNQATTRLAGQDRLLGLSWLIHDEFLSFPGFATHLSRPHTHNHESLENLKGVVVLSLQESDVPRELCDASWYIYITSLVHWLSLIETPAHLGREQPTFPVYLDSLLRGLPTHAYGKPRPIDGGQ